MFLSKRLALSSLFALVCSAACGGNVVVDTPTTSTSTAIGVGGGTTTEPGATTGSGTISTCLTTGESCGTDADCCSFTCDGTCLANDTGCTEAGDACIVDADCCSMLCGDSGVCLL